MNDLHAAYAVFGLSPGASYSEVNQRFKKLVRSNHPDKFSDPGQKAQAEMKIKAINNARDLLKAHLLSSDHNQTGRCDCRPVENSRENKNGQGQANENPGPKASASSEPQRGAGNPQKTPEHKKPPEPPQKPASFERTEQNLGQEKLRRLASFILAASFASLTLFLACADLAIQSDPETDYAKVLNSEWKDYQSDKAQIAFRVLKRGATGFELAQWRPPYVSSEQDASKLSQLAYLKWQAPGDVEQKEQQRQIVEAGKSIRRYEYAIKSAKEKLGRAQIVLNAPDAAQIDKEFARSEIRMQSQFLEESESNLVLAQNRLDVLTGKAQDTVPNFSRQQQTTPLESVSDPGRLPSIDMTPVVSADGSM